MISTLSGHNNWTSFLQAILSNVFVAWKSSERSEMSEWNQPTTWCEVLAWVPPQVEPMTDVGVGLWNITRLTIHQPLSSVDSWLDYSLSVTILLRSRARLIMLTCVGSHHRSSQSPIPLLLYCFFVLNCTNFLAGSVTANLLVNAPSVALSLRTKS